MKFDVAPSSFNRRKMLNTHPTPKAEVHCNLRGVLSTVPLTVFLSMNAFSFSASPFGGGAPWQIGTPDGEFEDPCPHACLPAVGLVVLPVCCRSHWHLGRKSKAPHATPDAEVRSETTMHPEGSWERLQNSPSTVTPAEPVSTARACFSRPIGVR